MTTDITDITIIGAGPTGLFGAFYAGMRGASCRLIDALPALGAGGMPPWRNVVLLTSAQALLGTLLGVAAVRRGPYLSQGAPFDWRYALRALADRGTRLANLGYLGHMWELYAVWTWAPLLLLASYQAAGLPASGEFDCATALALFDAQAARKP